MLVIVVDVGTLRALERAKSDIRKEWISNIRYNCLLTFS